MRRDRRRTLPVANAVLDLAEAWAMPIWENAGRFFRAWASRPIGDQVPALAEMRHARERWRELSQGWNRPYLSALLAEAEADTGRSDIALAELGDILTETSSTEQRMFDAELHQIRGEVLLKRDPANTGRRRKPSSPPWLLPTSSMQRALSCARRCR
jgi:predicted ATPase